MVVFATLYDQQHATTCGVDPGHIRTIPNGVDAAVFHPRDRVVCRQTHGIPTDVPVVLSAGQLIELKGHHRIVAAMLEIVGPREPAHLIIAGGPGRHGQYEAETRRQIGAAGMEGRVRLVGQVPQETLAELMSAADVFCLASSREG